MQGSHGQRGQGRWARQGLVGDLTCSSPGRRLGRDRGGHGGLWSGSQRGSLLTQPCRCVTWAKGGSGPPGAPIPGASSGPAGCCGLSVPRDQAPPSSVSSLLCGLPSTLGASLPSLVSGASGEVEPAVPGSALFPCGTAQVSRPSRRWLWRGQISPAVVPVWFQGTGAGVLGLVSACGCQLSQPLGSPCQARKEGQGSGQPAALS